MGLLGGGLSVDGGLWARPSISFVLIRRDSQLKHRLEESWVLITADKVSRVWQRQLLLLDTV